MEYEWDETKRRANLEKHRIDLSAAGDFDWDTAVEELTIRHGEIRYVSTGYIGNRIHTVIWTERGGRRRIISLRRASRQEERNYAQA